MLHVQCPCGKVLNVSPNLAGRLISCPKCGAPITLPTLPPGAALAAQAVSRRAPPATDRPALTGHPPGQRLVLFWGPALLILVIVAVAWVCLDHRGGSPPPSSPSTTENPAPRASPPASAPARSGDATKDALADAIRLSGGQPLAPASPTPSPAPASPAAPVTSPPPTPAPPPAPPTAPVEKSLADLVEQCGKSVVMIETDRGRGTGWLAGNGLVVTNVHVLAGMRKVAIVWKNPFDVVPLRVEAPPVIALDPKSDLALLQIPSTYQIPCLTLSDGRPVRAGEKVFVIGNPGIGNKTLDNTVTEGIVSSPDREMNGVHYVQISAAVNPGNSGGPVLDMTGTVVGVVTIKVKEAEGLGFAVSYQHVRDLLDKRDSAYRVRGDPITALGSITPEGPAVSLNDLPPGSKQIDVGDRIYALWVEPSGRRLFALDYDQNALLIIDPPWKQTALKLFVGAEPLSMTPSNDGRVLYVPCRGTQDIAVIDVDTAKEKRRMATSDLALCVAPADSKGGLFYLALGKDPKVPSLAFCYHDDSEARDVRLWTGGDARTMSPDAIAWVPAAETAVWMVPSPNPMLVLAHASPPRPEDPEKLAAWAHRRHRGAWEAWSVEIHERDLEGAAVIVEGSSRSFITAKRRWSLETGDPVQKGYFKPADYPGLSDERYKAYIRILRVLDNIMATSRDGSLAASGTHVYDAKTYVVRCRYPFPCETVALTTDTLFLYDPVSRAIDICPIK